MNLEPLHAETLRATQQVAAELFPWEHEHQEALPASLCPRDYHGFYLSRGLDSVRCWTALSGATVGGMAMLYSYQARRDELWLAWFGLKAGVRGKGTGARFLDWVISQARNEGRKALRLWTTDEDEYKAAINLYTRRGFSAEITAPLPGESWNTLVFSLGLDGRAPTSWASIPNHGELCGREMPQLIQASAA
jgi:GNAT superfamily N-acetyltransferase